MLLGELIKGLNIGLANSGAADMRVCDLTEDSRTVLPGSMYIARKGDAADGNDYIAAAVQSGAVAVLTDQPIDSLSAKVREASHPVTVMTAPDVPLATAQLAERFYGDPSSKLMVLGVTGTNGKTTTTYLIHQLLNAAHVRTGLVGTVCVDDGTEVAPATMTTPPALELSRTLARMLEAGCRAAVLEVSSHSLAQRRVAAMNFDGAAFTNLTGDHLDYHRTMEEYAAAKAVLFRDLKSSGAAVVNVDDPAATRMVQECRAPVFGTSFGQMETAFEGSMMTVEVGRGTRWGTNAGLKGPWGLIETALPFVGRHNLMNAVEAAALVWAIARQGSTKLDLSTYHLEMSDLVETLRHSVLPPGRLQCLTTSSDAIAVYVDYAHTDDALRTVLKVFRDVLEDGRAAGARSGRLIVVFGCGGDRDRTKRPRMGAVAAELADRVYVTSDNPRTEDPTSIIEAIVAGMPAGHGSRVVVEPDRERAIHSAIEAAMEGDVIVIAGKGHEDYQILPASSGSGTSGKAGTIKRFFDDRLVARDALRARGIEAQNPVPTFLTGRPAGTHVQSRHAGIHSRTGRH